MEEGDNSSQIIKPKKSFGLRFSLIWTLFFMILGIFLQSFEDQNLVLGKFFGTNYLQWFQSFTNIADMAALNSWYYFFFTGGIIAVMINLILWIVHILHKDPSSDKSELKSLAPSVIKYEPQTQVAKEEATQSLIENKEKPQEIKRIESVTQTKIEEWLEMGLLMLSEGNREGAELVYEQISRAYDIDKDISHETYKRILDFYYALNEKKK